VLTQLVQSIVMSVLIGCVFLQVGGRVLRWGDADAGVLGLRVLLRAGPPPASLSLLPPSNTMLCLVCVACCTHAPLHTHTHTQIGTTQSSVVRRQPVLFFCVINQGIFAALVRVGGWLEGECPCS
jgi:hypothetical protein